MVKTKKRLYSLYNDAVEVVFSYDESLNRFFGDYPDFDQKPQYTPCGRRWVNATKEDCPFADDDYGDCGSCRHFKCENPGDLIGVCENEHMRKEDCK